MYTNIGFTKLGLIGFLLYIDEHSKVLSSINEPPVWVLAPKEQPLIMILSDEWA
jgi:hypothetical protein